MGRLHILSRGAARQPHQHHRRARWVAPASAFALCAAVVTAAGSATLLVLLGLVAPPAAVNGYVPWDLTNFQNEYACDNSTVRIVRPRTVEDVQAAVRRHSSIIAVGGGWSWNQGFFCSSNGTPPFMPNGYKWSDGNASNSSTNRGSPSPSGPANIVMQTLRPLRIEVNETEESVTVDAGVRTIDLLRYLAAYVTPRAPAGWTLPAFPWFVFQTLGGAVSTNTHGSSLKHSSLSSQVLALTMVMADGSLRTFTNETDPFLMKAVRVGVGKLGIITHIKFRILREVPVTRTVHALASTQFLALLRSAQDQWNANGTLPEWMDETEWFWVPQRHEFLMVSFTRGDIANATKRLEVLTAYARAGTDSTTAYNTSLALLEQAVNGNVTVDDFPILHNVTFDPVANISNVALPVLRRLNETILNVPWQQSPGAGVGAGADIAAAATNASAAAAITPPPPPVAALDGPAASASSPSPSSSSIKALSAAVAAGRGPKPAVKSDVAPAAAAMTRNAVAAKTTMMGTEVSDQAEKAQVVSLFKARGDSNNRAEVIAAPNRRVINGTGVDVNATNEVADGFEWSIPQARPATVFYGIVNMADAYIDISRSGVYSIAANATKEAQSSYLFQPESILEINIRRVVYDQYEVAMPVSSMADCWQGLLELLYGADNLNGTEYNGTASPLSIISKLANNTNGTALMGPDGRPDYGFRTNGLIRATGNEDGLLSPSGGQPHLWLNIEDYLYYNRPAKRSNVVFKALMGYLRGDRRCGNTGLSGAGARLHWGKAGWPDEGCWHGDKEYPDTWCDFGCAVRQLDPIGKFRDSAPDRWNWEGVPLARCCVKDRGFKRPAEDPACVCKVAHKRAAETCPPPPYYSYR